MSGLTKPINLLYWTAAAIMLAGCTREPLPDLSIPDVPRAPTTVASVKAFCGDCHPLPDPASFAKERWHHEVEQGFRLYAKSGRDDLTKPDFETTLAFFRDQAPQEITFEPTGSEKDELFQLQKLNWTHDRQPVAISNIQRMPGSQRSFAMTDIGSGALFQVTANVGSELEIEILGEAAHPSHIETGFDFDGDDQPDFLVADLGTLNPEFADQASVWAFQANDSKQGDRYQRRPIKLGLSRVADARPIDHNNDGRMDLVVSDFGMHFVGATYLLTNKGFQGGRGSYDWSVLDGRAGAIATPVVDFNGDGKQDIVALVSQHYESIELHLNMGDGKFETKTIYKASDPSHGSSSIQVVDFDGDGDLDLVYTNGDTFDDGLAKPYHAIRWFENEGGFPFKRHDVTSMPGAYCAAVGDIDLDGDMDIAAVSLLGEEEVNRYPKDSFDGIIWLQQQSDGSFKRYSILSNECRAATCRLVDWDGDNDLDLLVPPYRFDLQTSDSVSLYINPTK